ncbi:hypothetical protein KHC28_11360 [Ancylobacter sonchi]|uniref:hypothetical protein n=1 Tax=Ancylobacter sonchi TaxID=1937790 RepID=UPI001BD6024C|nr:hypothetical protein [Ancylobacter sonchi]MBS7534256.1 hypothetical protein [Ancylobacter sonchi]
MTARVDPLNKVLRHVSPAGELGVMLRCRRYATDPTFRADADEVLRHAGLVDIASAVLVDGKSLEEAGRDASGYSTRVQAVAFATGQLAAAGRLLAYAASQRAQERSTMANAARRIARLERDIALRDAALKARAAIPA